MLTQLKRSAQLLLIPLLIGLAGCENNNLFSKLHGESSNPVTLNEQAAIALRNKDFSKALELANKVLAQDPADSQALYNAAAAKMGIAGLNLGVLVSNVLTQVGSSSVASDLESVVMRGRDGVRAQDSCGGASSLVNGLNCDTLINAMGSVIDDLRTIADGRAHGTIASNDIAMLFDLAILYILDAALVAVSSGYLDVVNNGGTYGVIAGPHLNDLCTTQPGDLIYILRQISLSYRYLDIIALRSTNNSSLIRNVRDDVNEVGQKLLATGGDQVLPQQCFDNVLNTHVPPITKDNYTSVL